MQKCVRGFFDENTLKTHAPRSLDRVKDRVAACVFLMHRRISGERRGLSERSRWSSGKTADMLNYIGYAENVFFNAEHREG